VFPVVTLLLSTTSPIGELILFNLNLFGALPELFLGVFIGFFLISIVLGVIGLKFQKDIVAGNTERIVHAIILGIVIFVFGSNIGGSLVGFGAFLCHISPVTRKTWLMPKWISMTLAIKVPRHGSEQDIITAYVVSKSQGCRIRQSGNILFMFSARKGR
jgi:hypothetical protein